MTRSDTGLRLTAGTIVLNPTIKGKLVAHREQVTNGTATLRLTIPKTARGKQLKFSSRLGSTAPSPLAPAASASARHTGVLPFACHTGAGEGSTELGLAARHQRVSSAGHSSIQAQGVLTQPRALRVESATFLSPLRPVSQLADSFFDRTRLEL